MSHPQNLQAGKGSNREFALAEKLRMNATLLSMMVEGEARLSREHLRSLVDDLKQHAADVERMQGRAA